ncbi:MAG: glycine--tRNA ligase [Sulfobacillus sp.]
MKEDLLIMNSLCRELGLIWGPEPECYEPVAGHYTYGPLGKALKNSVENYLRRAFDLAGFSEIECPVFCPKVVWERSGHWQHFEDPMVRRRSGEAERLDHLLEREFPGRRYQDFSPDQVTTALRELNSRIDKESEHYLEQVDRQNLMMTATSGGQVGAFRPETATTTYLSFPNAFQYFGQQLPIKMFQIGKAFRNEISPRHSVVRSREFTQAEAQVFLSGAQKSGTPELDDDAKDPAQAMICVHSADADGGCHAVLAADCGFSSTYFRALAVWAYSLVSNIYPEGRVRLRRHAEDEKAFYAIEAWDIELYLDSLGWTEVCGIHDRGQHDLKFLTPQSQSQSQPSLQSQSQPQSQPPSQPQSLPGLDSREQARTQTQTQTQARTQTQTQTQGGLPFDCPHVLEVAFGVDRLVYALVDAWFDQRDPVEGKTVFRLPRAVAPIQVSVFPLVKNRPEILDLSEKVRRGLRRHFRVEYDSRQQIGRRYLRSALHGVPLSVTVDYQSTKDQSVTVRDRDTEKQIRIQIEDLEKYIRKFYADE